MFSREGKNMELNYLMADVNPATGVNWTTAIIITVVALIVLVGMGILSKVFKKKKDEPENDDSE